jgi:hypothetical protein
LEDVANIDLKQVYREHYSAKASEPVVVDVPSRPFLMIDGAGDPNTSEQYRNAVEALYPLAYGLRAAVKRLTGDAYVVMPLEGLWWSEQTSPFDPANKSAWLWTAMICLPEMVTASMSDDVLPAVGASKHLVAGDLARVELFSEGKSAQVLHVGSYADESPTIAKLHEYIEALGCSPAGKHHEIYLSDPRTTDPAKLRTIIRQPFTDTQP